MTEFNDFTATDIDGQQRALSEWSGQVALIVNVASKCGFTPQYAGLESLWREYRERGFVVLGFPCDQFGHQEPGDDAEIRTFCSTSYDVTFPMFSKIEVNGDGASPLYQFLKDAQPGDGDIADITWNFEKFLVDGSGTVVKRYPPQTTPDEIAADLDQFR